MFYSLTGKIVYIDRQSVAISCGGVAYKCTVSYNSLAQIGSVGSEATLYTYLQVREDAMELYGFAQEDELELFKLLISVSGVGPKVAVAVLSVHTTASLSLCIASGDVKSIAKSQGVGAKTAQRIVLELKDKLAKIAPSTISADALPQGIGVLSEGNAADAISALASLGFSQSEAARVIAGLDTQLPTEALIKQGLKLLTRGN